MSESTRSGSADDDHSFWADREPEPEAANPGWLHSRVFGLGVLTMAGAVLGLAGLTWAGSSASELSPAQIAAAKAAPAGACTFTVDDKSIPLEAVRARSLTMIAAVGHQVAAPDIQIARAIDIAMDTQGAHSAQVMDALALLAKDDAVPATGTGLAQLHALGTPGALTCRYVPGKLPVETKGDIGLTKRADKVRTAVLDAFGKLPTSGYTKPEAKPKSKRSPKSSSKASSKAQSSSKSSKAQPVKAEPAESAPKPATLPAAIQAAPEGRVVDVLVAPQVPPGGALDPATKDRGWHLAHWLVARGEVYKLESVEFDDHTWSAASAAGWQPLPADALTRSLDRVHITVQRGG